MQTPPVSPWLRGVHASENATDAAARELAEKENAADLIFSGAATPTPHNDALLSFVLADLSQTSWLQHSLEFGQMAMNASLANLSQYKIAKEGLKTGEFCGPTYGQYAGGACRSLLYE